MKTTTIQKWGNSYAVRLPKAEVERLNLHEGQSVQVAQSESGLGLSILPTDTSSLTLEQMCALITPENRHPETDWGPPVGKEIW